MDDKDDHQLPQPKQLSQSKQNKVLGKQRARSQQNSLVSSDDNGDKSKSRTHKRQVTGDNGSTQSVYENTRSKDTKQVNVEILNASSTIGNGQAFEQLA